MTSVLLLNMDFCPISILPLSVIGWRQAIKLVFLDKITVLHEYEDWKIHSPTMTINVPAVAVTREYFNTKKIVRLSRRNIYLRDLFTCQYCEEVFPVSDLSLDHVKPKAAGGKTEWENIVTACESCNSKKGSKLMSPIRAPYKPNYWQLVKNMSHDHIHVKHPSWLNYIQLDEWKQKATA